MSETVKTFLFLLALLILGAYIIFDQRSLSWDPLQRTIETTAAQSSAAEYSPGFVTNPSPTRSVHAPAVSELSDGSLMTVWYGGEREGAKDVALYASFLPAPGADWTVPVKVLDRQRVADDLGRHIRKLGNAVLLSGQDQEVLMFFVTTSIGGWSTSSINMTRSTDGGKSWGRVKNLVSSPFLNLSTLVKGQPFYYQDRTIGLPVYHELAGKFSELLRVDKNGAVHDKVRLTYGRDDIQPDIAITGDHSLLAVLRDTSGTGKIFQAGSDNGGLSWTAARATALPNPNSAVAVTGNENHLVLAYNDADAHRNPLSLAISADKGASWKKIADVEASAMRPDNNKDEFSYPYIIQSRDGNYHLVYTWKREQIAYLTFNPAWLNKQYENQQ